jgi:hypothetical protein
VPLPQQYAMALLLTQEQVVALRLTDPVQLAQITLVGGHGLWAASLLAAVACAVADAGAVPLVELVPMYTAYCCCLVLLRRC